MNDKIVKKCSFCNRDFTAMELANDPELKLVGMLYMPGENEKAYYFYQHEVKDCGTSIAVDIEVMKQFITESIPDEKLTLSKCCEEHCVNIKDLSECQQECYYAPFRRFLFKMIDQKKQVVSNLTK